MRNLLFSVMAVIMISGCGGGFLITGVKIDKLHPAPESNNVPLDVVLSFRVIPADAWVNLNIVYTDNWGYERHVYFRIWRETEKFWNRSKYYVQFSGLLLPNTEYMVWVQASHYDYGDKVIPGHRWKFKTGS